MKCEHVHKDDPENAVCEDCSRIVLKKCMKEGILVSKDSLNKLTRLQMMKGGKK